MFNNLVRYVFSSLDRLQNCTIDCVKRCSGYIFDGPVAVKRLKLPRSSKLLRCFHVFASWKPLCTKEQQTNPLSIAHICCSLIFLVVAYVFSTSVGSMQRHDVFVKNFYLSIQSGCDAVFYDQRKNF